MLLMGQKVEGASLLTDPLPIGQSDRIHMLKVEGDVWKFDTSLCDSESHY